MSNLFSGKNKTKYYQFVVCWINAQSMEKDKTNLTWPGSDTILHNEYISSIVVYVTL